MALQSWDKVIDAVDVYSRVITGTQPANAVHMHSLMATNIRSSAKSDAEVGMPDTQLLGLVANMAIQDTSRSLCRDIFSAPLVRGTFPRPSDLQNVANEYSGAANVLR